MANIIGTNGNDTLYSGGYDDTLTGGGGNDIYDSIYYNTSITITDFGGVGKGVNPSAAVIAEVDTLNLVGNYGFTARNLVLTQNGSNLEITFDAEDSPKLILQNFALENLDNLSLSTGATVNSGNILFSGQTTITDSFDVFNANSTQSTIFNLNTVTFLNDLNNNVSGFDNSDDAINGQGGDDKIDGKSGNDLLRGGAGNNILIGGVGNDILDVEYSTGNNILNGGSGDDYLDAGATSGNNLLFGGDGNDTLSTSYVSQNFYNSTASSGNNTLNGGTGDDYLDAKSPSGNNLLFGGDGNDTLSTSGVFTYRAAPNFISSGNNTLNGGAGDDTLDATNTKGNNLLSGGDGNDSFNLGIISSDGVPSDLATQTVNGGNGNDLLSMYCYYATKGIASTFDATTNTGSVRADTYLVNYDNVERLNIFGTDYNDLIVGSNGNDTLTGGKGNDSLIGGNGTDTFVFYNYNEGVDDLYDFNATNDLIQISAFYFAGGLSKGSLSANQFTLGTSATTSNQLFIYDFITGGLYFDQDGSAAGFSQIKFAQLSAGLSLTENNFVVV